jgi:hypothetical protein
MLARCARCQGTFSTDRFGVQRCPHCGSEVLLADPNAPAPAAPAGEPPGPPPPPPSGAGPPPGALPPPGAAPPSLEAELPAPFVERKERGFFPAFFQTWKLSALEPAHFFRRVRIDQTASAVWFAVIATTVGTWVSTIFGYLGSAGTAQQLREALDQLPAEAESWRSVIEGFASEMTVAGLVGRLLSAPLVSLVALYLGAGVVHLLLMLFRGAQRGFGATLTAAGYASGLGLLSAVPGCGGLVAMVWSAVVFVIGLGATQRCGTGKAAAAVLLPVVLVCACGAALAAFGVVAAIQAAAGTTSL